MKKNEYQAELTNRFGEPEGIATIRKIDTQSKLYTTTGITKRVSPAAKTKLIIKPHPSRA